jgi:hypothetical protein
MPPGGARGPPPQRNGWGAGWHAPRWGLAGGLARGRASDPARPVLPQSGPSIRWSAAEYFLPKLLLQQRRDCLPPSPPVAIWYKPDGVVEARRAPVTRSQAGKRHDARA